MSAASNNDQTSGTPSPQVTQNFGVSAALPTQPEIQIPLQVNYYEVVRCVPDRFIDAAKQILDKVIEFGHKKGFDGLKYSIKPNSPIFFGENNMFSVLTSDFVITQPVIAMGDYNLIAKIEHGAKGEGNLIKRGDFQDIPNEYLTCEPDCEHCHTKRDRNITWIVKHKETDNYSQIGSSCISEYTMYDDANAAIRYFDVLNDMNKLLAAYNKDQYGLDDESNFGASIPFDYSVEHIIATTLAIMARENNTYVSTSKAFELSTLSTSDLVKAQYSMKPLFKKLNTFEYVETARNVIEWVSAGGLPEKIKKSSFGHNLETLITRKAVSEKNMGVIIPAAPFYNNYMSEKLSQKLNSNYQGEVGERIERDLIVRKIIPIDGMYGTQYITVMNDPEGNVYKWKTASVSSAALNEPYKAKMTVKDHECFRDTNQTSVLRVKFFDLEIVEKLHSSMSIKDFTKSISKLSNPNLRIKNRGVDVGLDKYLREKCFFNDAEKLHAYLALPGVDVQNVLENNNLIFELREYANNYREVNAEAFNKLIEFINERSEEDLSALIEGKSGLTMS